MGQRGSRFLTVPTAEARDRPIWQNRFVPAEDPGWAVSWRTLLWLFIPGLGIHRQRQRANDDDVDGLLMLRQLFLSFCLAIVAFGIVLAVLYPGSTTPNDPPTAVAVALLVAGALSTVAGQKLERPLSCEDDAKLAESYRKRFFLRLAFSEVPALLGFVAFFLTYAWWPYPIGAAITAMGFRRAAPTSTRLARDQEELTSQGCQRSLIAALRHMPSASKP